MTRGLTGHEHIDGLGVIHMNGRIYDPDLGRFLQPDPVIQAPNNAQSWNAYTYVFNNPLRYTDPTGMIGIEERQWAGAAVAIVMTAIYPGSATMWYSMLTGMVAGWVSTGNMQGAITGAISAGLFAGIGSYFETARWANAQSGTGAFGSGLTWGGYGAKSLSHGVAGGVMSSMQGGKFGHGFASAGAAQAFSPMINHFGTNAPARIATAALVGGTASVLSGGKFASGAITAAFSRAFNDEMHRETSEQHQMLSSGDGYFESRIPWLEYAAGQLGVTEVAGRHHSPAIVDYHSTTGRFLDDETPWCSSFVSWVIQRSAISGTNSAMALSWRSWGVKLSGPAYGSIAVINSGGGKGHVGFVVGATSSGRIVLLGGNQSNSVKYSSFSASSIAVYVYPKGYAPSYHLPLVNMADAATFQSTR